MQTIEDIENIIHENLAVMVYFSAPTCSVCQALKPKLIKAVDENFKDFMIISIDTSANQEIAAYFSVFTIPTILVFLDSKEFLRKSRHMSIDEVVDTIKRPYDIMTS